MSIQETITLAERARSRRIAIDAAAVSDVMDRVAGRLLDVLQRDPDDQVEHAERWDGCK